MADIGSKGVVLPLGAALAALAQALTLTQAALAKAEGAVEDTAEAIAAAAEAAMILAMMLAMIAMQWLTIADDDLGLHCVEAGPASLEELFDWPLQILTALGEDAVKSFLMLFGQGKVKFYSDFSGIDCYRWAMTAVEDELRRQGHLQGGSSIFEYTRACDWARTSRAVLKAVINEVDHGQGCIFVDIADRLAPDAKTMLLGMMPPEAASQEDKVAAFAAMQTWLGDNRNWAYRGTSKCEKHAGRECPTHPGPFARLPLDVPKQVHKRLRVMSSDPEFQPVEKVDRKLTSDEPLYVNTSGMVCTGWSVVGHRGDYGDPIKMTNHIWLTQRT